MQKFKDLYKRKNYKTKEIYYLILKYIYIKNGIKFNYNYNFFIKKKIKTKSKIRNYCLVTSRSRAFMSIIKCSRLKFKEYVLSGYCFGIMKASW